MTETCHCCGQRIKLGQSKLTRSEKRRLDLGGPNDQVNIINAQVIKAAAEYYGVNDWIQEWDSTLTNGENISQFRRKGNSPTMRELQYQR